MNIRQFFITVRYAIAIVVVAAGVLLAVVGAGLMVIGGWMGSRE